MNIFTLWYAMDLWPEPNPYKLPGEFSDSYVFFYYHNLLLVHDPLL